MSDTYKIDYHFVGEGAVSAAADESQQPFIQAVTGAAPPTATYVGNVAGAVGVLQLALTADSQTQNLCVYGGDVLSLNATSLKSVEFRARLSTALGTTATTMVAFGLASERNDAIDSIAEHALFRVLGDASAAVIVESDDGATDLDDKATGFTLSTTWKRFGIDFSKGLADVRFFMDDNGGRFTRVAAATTFDMSGLTDGEGLQFFAQIQKAANTNVGTLQIDRFSVLFNEYP